MNIGVRPLIPALMIFSLAAHHHRFGSPLQAPPETVSSHQIRWVSKADLPLPHRNGKAVAAGGKIYFMGGYCPATEEEREASNYEYDPQEDRWTSKVRLPLGRSNFALTSWKRKILVIGGDPALPNNDLFLPDENRWEELAPLSVGRQHVDCGRIGNKVYVVGGVIRGPRSQQDSEQQIPRVITPTVEIYDIEDNRWDMGCPLPEARHGVQVAAVAGKLYAIGGASERTRGQTISSAFERYDPESESWESLPSLPFPILAPGIAVVGEKIFIVGGSTIENDTRTASEKVCVYDTRRNLWGMGTPLPKRIQFPGVVAIDNRIYVIGGCDSEFNAFVSVYEGMLAD